MVRCQKRDLTSWAIQHFEMSDYYKHFCGGEFSVDLSKQSYGIAPCIYSYVCDKCGKTKLMVCQAEMLELTEKAITSLFGENQLRRSYKLR